MFSMRFDMRAPASGAPAADLYEAALDMAAWAESRGAVSVTLCEHHTSSDGYLPSPLVLGSAIAARTERLRIMISVVLLPLYDPVRLAEEMCVLDLISRGRVRYVAAIGYRPVEYEMYDVDFHRRGAIAEQKLKLLLKARTGEPFVHEGRRIHVTPAPYTRGGPRIGWGGGGVAAARRAGRHGLDFMAQIDNPTLRDAYLEAAHTAGREPGAVFLPPKGAPSSVFVADDLDAAWAEVGPYLLHDALMYAEWTGGADTSSTRSHATTVEQLRAENGAYRIFTVDEAIAHVRTGAPLGLHPLVGGLPPEIAWRYLRTVADRVMPEAGRARS
jgi:alkanesulfonate monooxygenase SsuD/methylene tetrahydromethanopterin reductase-like flavin-dependent oxidoreductase (luciferase family)